MALNLEISKEINRVYERKRGPLTPREVRIPPDAGPRFRAMPAGIPRHAGSLR